MRPRSVPAALRIGKRLFLWDFVPSAPRPAQGSVMPLLRKLAAFQKKAPADRLLICEAIVTLALARMVVLTVPFRFIARWAARTPDNGACNSELLVRVRKAVTTAARNVPWNAVCLPQAIAAKMMLARRGQGSVFHLGARLDADGKLNAHAWLVVGDTVVVGAAGMAGMAPLGRFG